MVKVSSDGTPFDIVKQLVAGGIAGSCAKSFVAPVERVKILFQINSPEYPYTGVFGTLKQIQKKEGLRGFYKGNFSSVVRVFPYAAIQFLGFDKYKKLFMTKDNKMPVYGNFFAGSMAGATALIFTYPLDLIRARLAAQVNIRHYTGISNAIKTIYKEAGIIGLNRGIMPSLWGILPYAGINFFTYETLKRIYIHEFLPEGGTQNDIPTYIRLTFGSTAGLVGQTMTYPLDVIRRRMQMDGFVKGFNFKYKSTFEAFLTILKSETWRGLFKGLSINYIKAVPMVSVSFTTYDLLKKYWNIK